MGKKEVLWRVDTRAFHGIPGIVSHIDIFGVLPFLKTSPSYKKNTATTVRLNHRDFPLNELNDYIYYPFISVKL